MGKEIEWRFLVTRLPAIPTATHKRMVQAYFNEGSPGVRVRLAETEANLTIKAETDEGGEGAPLVRHEFVYPVPKHDAEELIALCGNRVDKTRYYLPGGIELDVFHGACEGLVLAEVEVEEAGEAPRPPEGWEWTDISTDMRYSNQSLALSGLPEGWRAAEIG